MRWMLFLCVITFLFAQNESNDTNAKSVVKAEQNSSKELNSSKEQNKSKNLLEKNIQKQIEKEKKYKKEQKFYMGKNYNTKELEVKPQDLQNVPIIEPEYDFDMDDVY